MHEQYCATTAWRTHAPSSLAAPSVAAGPFTAHMMHAAIHYCIRLGLEDCFALIQQKKARRTHLGRCTRGAPAARNPNAGPLTLST